MQKVVKLQVEDHIGHVIIQRADKANAFDLATWHALRDAFREADRTAEVRCVLLRAEGKHFSAGIDLSLLMQIKQEIDAMDCPGRAREHLLAFIKELQACIQAIEDCRKPVIALIQGGCIGGGVDIISACDIRLCSAQAYFSVKEVDLGIVADLGTLQRLRHLVGEGIAREWAFTARNISAQEAYECKLVNRVEPDSEHLLQAGIEMARIIAAKSPLAVRGTKQVMNYSRDHSVAEGLEYVALWNAAQLLSKDIESAMIAAFQKQTPSFQN
jgi:enoyl-CoA hydratase